MKIKRVIIAITAIILVLAILFLVYLFYQPLMNSLNCSTSESVKTIKNITYTPNQSLDIYLPNKTCILQKPLPTIILIHRGGWYGGRKEDLSSLAIPLAKKGYASISVDYSWSSKQKFPAQIKELNASVQWVKQNSKK